MDFLYGKMQKRIMVTEDFGVLRRVGQVSKLIPVVKVQILLQNCYLWQKN